MAVYHFTLHAYRSWNANNPRGFVKRDQGIQPPDPVRARMYDRLALQEPILFTPTHQQIIEWIVSDACIRRGWRLHGIACESTHVHILVSWHEYMEWQVVLNKLKNLMSLELGKFFQIQGRRWFVDKGSRKRVSDRRHFDHLMNQYFPKHKGRVWREGNPLPLKPSPFNVVFVQQ